MIDWILMLFGFSTQEPHPKPVPTTGPTNPGTGGTGTGGAPGDPTGS